MFDVDPRDSDSRDEEHFAPREDRSPALTLVEQLQLLDSESRRLDVNAGTLAHGLDEARSTADARDGPDARDQARWPELDRDRRDRPVDSREPFSRGLDLPRGPERDLVRDRDRTYALRGSEMRTLATVGAFRVVSSRDLHGPDGRPLDPRSGDLRHLREQGLVETARMPGSREHAVALTSQGRSLLDHHRDRDQDGRQTFWQGLAREREREHDLQVYRAYEEAAERLAERDAKVERVVLDHELKRDYQRWLHEHDRDRAAYDGHPDRTDEEIRGWAGQHDLPYFEHEVHFPDVRIEYRDRDDREDHEDIEVTTVHYRGAHGASVARSGFACCRGSSLRIGGRGGSRRGGSSHQGGLAQEFW